MTSYLTGLNYIDALLPADFFRWNAGNNVGTGVNLTYSFLSSVPVGDGYTASAPELNGFAPFTEDEKTIARTVLAELSRIINVNFTEVSGASGDIRFGTTANDSGDFNGYAGYPGPRNGGDVWLNTDQLFIDLHDLLLHELGHAMGLKHDFEGTIQLPPEQDSYQYTVMSYNEDPVMDAEPASYMVDDVAALQHLYGANLATNAGNTIYSWAANIPFLETIWDGGGNDTIDTTNQPQNNLIDLRAGNFSSIGLATGPVSPQLAQGNMAIAYGVTIENLIAGSGDDTIIGNGANNHISGGGGLDQVVGAAGSDIFIFGSAALTDARAAIFARVIDFDQGNAGHFSVGEGDQIDTSAITGMAFGGGQAAGALVRMVDDPSNSHVLLQVDPDGTANGIHWGSLAQLDGLHAGDIVNDILDSTQPTGASFSVLSDAGHFGDFDGDGKADLLWRNDNGVVATWQMNGGSVSHGNFLSGVPNDWHIQGTGDFNGDGKADILWLNANGSLIVWQSADALQTATIGTQPTNTVLAGIGDFDSDHNSDLAWRDLTSGAVTINTISGASNTITGTGNDWQIVGVGDYNGDGMGDILFRNASQGVNAAWLMNGTTLGSAVFYPGVPNNWHVEGTGDFNGDGTSDLLWHNDNGANAVWLMKNDGSILTAGFFDGVSADWHVVGTGCFDGRTNNGHPIDDVVWRNDAGATAIWLMNGTQMPTVSFPGGVPNDWATQAHHYEYV